MANGHRYVIIRTALPMQTMDFLEFSIKKETTDDILLIFYRRNIHLMAVEITGKAL